MPKILSSKYLHHSEPTSNRSKDLLERFGNATFFARTIKKTVYTASSNGKTFYVTERKTDTLAALFFIVLLPISWISQLSHKFSSTHQHRQTILRVSKRVNYKVNSLHSPLNQEISIFAATNPRKFHQPIALKDSRVFTRSMDHTTEVPNSLFRLKSNKGFRYVGGLDRHGEIRIFTQIDNNTQVQMLRSNDRKLTHLLALKEAIRLDELLNPPPHALAPLQNLRVNGVNQVIQNILDGNHIVGGIQGRNVQLQNWQFIPQHAVQPVRRAQVQRIPPAIYTQSVTISENLRDLIAPELRNETCHLRNADENIEGHFQDKLDIVLQPKSDGSMIRITYNKADDLKRIYCLNVYPEMIKPALEAINCHRIEAELYKNSRLWRVSPSKKTEQFDINGYKYFDLIDTLATSYFNEDDPTEKGIQDRLSALKQKFTKKSELLTVRELEIKALIGNIVKSIVDTNEIQLYRDTLEQLSNVDHSNLDGMLSELWKILAKTNPLGELNTLGSTLLESYRQSPVYEKLSHTAKTVHDREDQQILANLPDYIAKTQNMDVSNPQIANTRYDNFKIALCSLHFLKQKQDNPKKRQALKTLSESAVEQLCDGARTNAGEVALNSINPMVKSNLMSNFLSLRDNFLESLIEEVAGGRYDNQNVHTMETMRNYLSSLGYATFKNRYDQFRRAADPAAIRLVDKVINRANFTNFLSYVYDNVTEIIELDNSTPEDAKAEENLMGMTGIRGYYHNTLKDALYERFKWLAQNNPEEYADWKQKLDECAQKKQARLDIYSDINVQALIDDAVSRLETTLDNIKDHLQDGNLVLNPLRKEIGDNKNLNAFQKQTHLKALEYLVCIYKNPETKKDEIEKLKNWIKKEAEERIDALKTGVNAEEIEILDPALVQLNWVHLDDKGKVLFISRQAIAEALVQAECAIPFEFVEPDEEVDIENPYEEPEADIENPYGEPFNVANERYQWALAQIPNVNRVNGRMQANLLLRPGLLR